MTTIITVWVHYCCQHVWVINSLFYHFFFICSQAVAVGNTVYLSGQVGIDPGTGNMVEGGIEPEAHQVSPSAIFELKHDLQINYCRVYIVIF